MAGFKFISYPYNCEYDSSLNVLNEYTIEERDVSVDDMLEAFMYFMKSVGYHFATDESFAVVSSNDDDGEVDVDDEAAKLFDDKDLIIEELLLEIAALKNTSPSNLWN